MESKDQAKLGRPPKSGEAATGHIHIRIPGALGRKTAYYRAAYPKPMAQWMAEILDRAAGYEA